MVFLSFLELFTSSGGGARWPRGTGLINGRGAVFIISSGKAVANKITLQAVSYKVNLNSYP